MRRLLSILTILAVSASVFAQNTVQYWFDRQTQRSMLSGTEISTAGLTTGLHFARFQITGTDGMLSPVKSAAFLVLDEQLTPPAGTSTVRYWFDRQTTKQNIATGTSMIDCSALANGLHSVHFQIVGADGFTGPVQSKMFIVLNEQVAHTSAYSAINYWFDRQTTMQAYTSGNIDCSALTDGIHALHCQLIDSNGLPCPVSTKFFITLSQSAYKLCYWFDDDDTRSLMDIDGTEISVESLSNGKHTLHAVIADSEGNVINGDEQEAEFTIVCADDEHIDDDADGYCDVCEELVAYVRATTPGRYGTICLPRASSAGRFTGGTFYNIAGKRLDANGKPSSFVLEQVSVLQAGRPYIFLASDTNIKVIYNGSPVNTAGTYKGLAGTFDDISVEEGKYLISNNLVVKCGPDCYLDAYRAFINMEDVPTYVEGQVSSAKMAVIGLDGTNGINNISLEGETVRYNLSGIRIPKGTKGIMIVNGKKVLNK